LLLPEYNHQVAFAALADVKQILGYTDDDPVRDAKLQHNLDVVESWAAGQRWRLSDTGPQMETYWDISEDATLSLPDDDSTITKVKVYEYPSSYGVPLSPISLGLGHGYDITNDGRIILRPVLQMSPFEGASAQRRLRQYSRVEVHYIGTGIIPQAVTEGIAFLAAGYTIDGPRALKGIKSERIGDYSYTLGDQPGDEVGVPSYVARANWLLVPFMHRQRVMVI
jgi:hypothetical protein